MNQRRSFLARAGAAAAALSLGPVIAHASPEPRVDGTWQPARHDKDEWLELPGSHRLIFDGISPEGVRDALQFAGNFFTGNRNGYGLDAADIAVVIVMRHRATQFAFTDAVWSKYGAALSESEEFVDPKTKQAPIVNVYRTQIENHAKRGVHIGACDLSTHRLASFIARKTQAKADDVYKELVANAMPNVHFVPAGIVCVSRAQERGYAVAHAG
jgi:intracellular sulfur oxidation DsrE/DsrF family protein